MEPATGNRANKQNADFAELLAETILSTGSDAIIATDRDGIIRFWNPGAERVFGHSHRDAVGRSLDLIIPERLRQRHWQGFTDVMRSGQSRYGEGDLLSVPAMRNDGTTLSVQFTIFLLRKAGQMVGMAAIIRDVTKQFQETRALKRALSNHRPCPRTPLRDPLRKNEMAARFEPGTAERTRNAHPGAAPPRAHA